MREIFEGYERKYCVLSDNLSKKCSAANLLDGDQKKQKISEIKTGLDEADALIWQMDLGVRALQPNVKAVLLSNMREYKSDLNNLKTEVKEPKGQIVDATEKLNNSHNRIRDSRTVMLETEELGVSLLHDLHGQRQSLLHANNTVSLLHLLTFPCRHYQLEKTLFFHGIISGIASILMKLLHQSLVLLYQLSTKS
ncbi:hypothetical protein ACJIZ3_010541 [Penstemon smallii]|uniref:Vesicle transport v-SNARE N-terminal domain-containing protein n=1 Tax=Penstemon smallii TaxID=265156 RepID=A0ABD3UGK5_9LAMI